MIFAQAVAEYGAIASMVAGVQHMVSTTQTWAENHVTETLIAAGIIVFLGLAFFRQRSSRL
jgi:hypothetical protein